MKKRGQREGSVSGYTLKSGEARWRITWTHVDPADEFQRPQRRWERGFFTRDEAVAALHQRLAGVGRPQGKSASMTLGDYLSQWIAGHRVAETTHAHYLRMIRLHIQPHIGHLALGKVSAPTLRALYRSLEASGLGPSTVLKVHTLLGIALEAAVEDGVLASNPSRRKGASPPTPAQVREAKKEIHVWTPGQMETFLEWSRINQPHYFPAWYLAAHTGLRRGEIVGLRWGDIDLDKGIVHVRRAVTNVVVKGEPSRRVTKAPKSGRSRNVAIDHAVVAVLRSYRRAIATLGLRRIHATRCVFTRPNGLELRPNSISERFEVGLARCHEVHEDLPQLTIHGLRHTHASHLLRAGVPAKVVQERLGHARIAITMDLYTHLMPDTQSSTVETFMSFIRAEAAKEREQDSPEGGLREVGDGGDEA